MIRGRHNRKLRLERLEGREMLAVFTVTNLNDAPVTAAGQAPGTLRQAIFDANNLAGADTIQFSAGLSGTIQLNVVGDSAQGASALLVTSTITIRGNTNGITIGRANAAPEMRLFRVATTGNLMLETIMLTNGLLRGANGAAEGMPGGDARGGAIFNQGTVEIVASTLYGNSAIGGNASDAMGGRAVGGAVANDGGTLTLKNTTLSGNSAAGGTGNTVGLSFGGGVYSLHGSLRIYNSTLTNNAAASSGRQVYVFSDVGTANVELFSSILGQSDAPQFLRDFVAISDVNGVMNISASHNVVRTQTGLESTQYTSDDPLLGPLLANGGPTLTHAFAAGSPTMNAGTNPLVLTVDQRGTGFSRSVAGVDIGSFELQTAPTLAGDYNRDGAVGAADYVVWRKTMGVSVSTYAGADGDGSGAIDPADLGVWSQHFGRTAAGGAGGEAGDESVVTSIASAAAVSSHLEDAWAEDICADEDADAVVEVALLGDHQATAADSRGKALLAALLEWQPVSRRDGIAFE